MVAEPEAKQGRSRTLANLLRRTQEPAGLFRLAEPLGQIAASFD